MKFIEEKSGSNFDSKDFAKIEDGKSMVGLLAGDPYLFKSHWNGKGSQVCTADCEMCKSGNKPTSRFRVNFIVKEGEAYVAKILEQGYNFGLMLEDFKERNDVRNTIIEIFRKGKGLHDTRYRVEARKDIPLTPSRLEAIKSVSLKDLHESPVKQVESEPPKFNENEDIPF